jgi:hypothetical protein
MIGTVSAPRQARRTSGWEIRLRSYRFTSVVTKQCGRVTGGAEALGENSRMCERHRAGRNASES